MSEGMIITYETLFDLLRREKARDELQELDSEFYGMVHDYLQEKYKLLNNSDDEFMDESEKMRIQISNIKKIVKELYERRERKIVNLAIFKSRLPRKVLDTRALLPVEHILYESVLDQLTENRSVVLSNLLTGREGPRTAMPVVKKTQSNSMNYQDRVVPPDTPMQTRPMNPAPETSEPEVEAKIENSGEASIESETNFNDESTTEPVTEQSAEPTVEPTMEQAIKVSNGGAEMPYEPAETKAVETKSIETNPSEPKSETRTHEQQTTETGETISVKFTNAVPKFLGTELEVYGPYEEEDVASLPSKIAEVLIQKGRAEEVAK